MTKLEWPVADRTAYRASGNRTAASWLPAADFAAVDADVTVRPREYAIEDDRSGKWHISHPPHALTNCRNPAHDGAVTGDAELFQVEQVIRLSITRNTSAPPVEIGLIAREFRTRSADVRSHDFVPFPVEKTARPVIDERTARPPVSPTF